MLLLGTPPIQRQRRGGSNGAVHLRVNGVTMCTSNGTGYASSSVQTTFNGCVHWVGHLDEGDIVDLHITPHSAITNNTAKQQHLEGVCVLVDPDELMVE